MNTQWALLMATLVVAFAQPQRQISGLGRIEGRVLQSDTGEPLSGVFITLAPLATGEQTEAFRNASAGRGRLPREPLRLAHDGVTVLQEELPRSKPIVTDPLGRFTIEDVPRGSYAVSARREGYFGRGSDPESPGTFDGAAVKDMVMTTVADGRPAIVAMELTPAASISGRVMSLQGMPIAGHNVHAFRAHRHGEATRLRGVTQVISDDRGQYRLHTLPPGEYYIASRLALARHEDLDPLKVTSPLVPGSEVPVLTFHPSTISPEIASSIVLSGGEDVSGKDIRVRNAPVLRISGEVINDSGIRDAASASVKLAPPATNWSIDFGGVLGPVLDSSGVLLGTSVTFADSNRARFEFRGVFPPGSYEVRATVRDAIGSARIDVLSQDVEGVVIVVLRPPSSPFSR